MVKKGTFLSCCMFSFFMAGAIFSIPVARADKNNNAKIQTEMRSAKGISGVKSNIKKTVTQTFVSLKQKWYSLLDTCRSTFRTPISIPLPIIGNSNIVYYSITQAHKSFIHTLATSAHYDLGCEKTTAKEILEFFTDPVVAQITYYLTCGFFINYGVQKLLKKKKKKNGMEENSVEKKMLKIFLKKTFSFMFKASGLLSFIMGEFYTNYVHNYLPSTYQDSSIERLYGKNVFKDLATYLIMTTKSVAFST